MKEKPANNWFYGVNSIRFILALVVMLSHFDNVYSTALKSSTHSFLKYAGYIMANIFDGTSAVIAFFIISGFVIHYPNKNGIPNLKEFWIRRFLRILVPLAVILIIGIKFNHPEKTVVWSLYCELVYYALYPLLAMIGMTWRSKFYIAYALAAVTICLLSYHDIQALIMQTNLNYHGYYWQLGSFLTWIVGLPCWMLGVLIAENIDKLNNIDVISVWKYRMLVFIVSCFCCFGKFHLHLSYIISMNIFALVLYKWLRAEIVYFKSHKPIRLLEEMGKFSYSLYLCHPLLYTILGLYISFNSYTYPIFILVVVLFAYGFYLLVEKPAHIAARKINARYNLAARI